MHCVCVYLTIWEVEKSALPAGVEKFDSVIDFVTVMMSITPHVNDKSVSKKKKKVIWIKYFYMNTLDRVLFIAYECSSIGMIARYHPTAMCHVR